MRATEGQPEIAKRIGRHVLIEQVGAGGMGVVYAAYDPKLDRKLAIKVLRAHSATSGGAARLLREAQAMARISHPNVVSVFDVGTEAGEVYIAMEFADGGTMRAWLRDTTAEKPWRDVLRRFVAAGKGLAAAHEAGLVHGDFKPDNVLFGSRGQVRVMDFGLARPSLSTPPPSSERSAELEPDVIATLDTVGTYGTPAYMAPEQFRQQPPDERSDQFSFCIAFYEGLYGKRPFSGANAATIADNVLAGRVLEPPRASAVPRWIFDIVLRGLAVEPDRRWPSMRELLAALRRDPTRRRRLAAVGVAVGLVGVGVAAAIWTQHGLTQKRCREAGEAVRVVWSSDRHAELRDVLAQSGAANAEQTFAKTVPWLDAYADAWQQARTEACLRGSDALPVELQEAARECLDDRLGALEVRVDLLLASDAAATQHAVQLVAGTPPIAPCSDERSLRSLPQLPADAASREVVGEVRRELVAAEAHLAAGELASGSELARDGLDRAEELGWAPLVAESELVLGQLRAKAGDYAEGERLLGDAVMRAGENDHDTVAADAAIALSQIVGYERAELDVGLVWSRVAGMYVARLGEQEGLRGAWHVNARGAVYAAAGRHAEAAAEFSRAVEMRTAVFGAAHPDVAASLSNLATILLAKGDLDGALAAFRRALDMEVELLGADHPNVADVHEGIGNVLALRGDGKGALKSQLRSLEIRTTTLGPDHGDTGDALLMVANAYDAMGDLDTCREYTLRAVAVHERALGPDHPTLALSLANLGGVYYHQDDYANAAKMLERALAIQRRVYGEHPDVVVTLNTLGNVERVRGDLAAAERIYGEAVAIGDRVLPPDHTLLAFPLTGTGQTRLDAERPAEAIAPLERALTIRANPDVPSHLRSFTAFNLAQALWDANVDRVRARELATQAEKAYAAGGESEAEDRTLVQHWLAEHPG